MCGDKKHASRASAKLYRRVAAKNTSRNRIAGQGGMSQSQLSSSVSSASLHHA
jgi:hypothetical protein